MLFTSLEDGWYKADLRINRVDGNNLGKRKKYIGGKVRRHKEVVLLS
jgi:hypothetical protein